VPGLGAHAFGNLLLGKNDAGLNGGRVQGLGRWEYGRLASPPRPSGLDRHIYEQSGDFDRSLVLAHGSAHRSRGPSLRLDPGFHVWRAPNL